MSSFKNEGLFNRGMLINQCILLISIILTMIFDDTIYEPIFRGIWILACILYGILLGTKEVVVNKNKLGYFYYTGIVVFILVLLKIYNI